MEGFVNNNIFDNVLKHSNNYSYYGVDKDYLERVKNQKNNKSSSDLFDLTNINENIDDAIETISTPNQNNKQRIKTLAIISGSTIVVGAATILLTKGKLTKSTTNLLNGVMKRAAKQIETIKKKPSISTLEGIYLLYLQKVNKTAGKIRGTIFNISPLKDVLFERFIREKCGLKKPCDAITKGFKKLSFATVKSSYQTTGKNFAEMTELFSQTNKKIANGEIQTKSNACGQDTAKILDKSVDFINKEFNSSFGQTSIDKRNNFITNRFKGLGKRVYNNVYGNIKEFVTDINEWTTFISERLVAKDKENFYNELLNKKRILTNNPDDNYKLMKDILTKLENTINPQNTKSRENLKSIHELTENYQKLSGAGEQEAREVIKNKINTCLKNTLKISEKEEYTNAQSKQIKSLLRNFGKIINADKKGAIEEILTLYKSILPKEEYLKLKKIADKTIKSLNKSVYTEGFDYVDKVRDLSVGSALTDVAIGMALPMTTTSVAMTRAKTKEKKRSVMLKYGLPLIAGVATSTLCTIKLISGGKSLMLGGAVTVIGNEIFERIDNYLISKNTQR